MEVKFKIIEIHQDQHSMVVRYYTDKITELDLASSYTTDENGNRVVQTREDGSPARCRTDVNINIWKTPTPTIDEIKKIANDSAPYDWFKLLHDIQDPNVDTSMTSVFSLLNQEFTAVNPRGQDSLSEIEKLINSLTSNTSNSS